MAENINNNNNNDPASKKRGRNALSPDYNLQKLKQANRRSYSAENKSIIMNEGFSPAMMAQMSKMMNDMTENINKSFKVQITQMEKKMQDEFKTIKECMSEEMRTIKEENRNLKSKQVELEKRIENMERREKRNNIIITGLQMEGQSSIKEATETLFSELTDRKMEISDAYQIGKLKTVVKMATLNDKISVMKNKGKLRIKKSVKPIFLDDDMTQEDRKIQYRARQFAKENKKEGNRIKIGFQKVQINENWYTWNESNEKFEQHTTNFQ